MTSVDSAAGETCFNLSVLDDTVLEEPLECLLLRIELPDDSPEMLNIAPGNDSTLCCITDDDSEFILLIHMTFFNSLQGPGHNCICLHMNFVCA